MSWTTRFSRKSHKYETKGELADMTIEEILRLDPDDVGFYIRNNTPGWVLSQPQVEALENLLDYKTRAKKIGRKNINREEEIKNYLLVRNPELTLFAETAWISWISKYPDSHILHTNFIDSFLGLSTFPIETEEEEVIFDGIERRMKDALKHITPTHLQPIHTSNSSTKTDIFLHLAKKREYYLTFSDQDSQLILKVKFIKYAEKPTSFNRSKYEKEITRIIRINNSREFQTLISQDEYPYYFIPNENNPLYGYFRIMEVVSSTNISMDSFYNDFTALTRNSNVPSIQDSLYTTPNFMHFIEEESNISWYINPGHLIWVLLSPTDNVLISNTPPPPPPIPNEEEITLQFLSTFTDYPHFIQFINEYLSQLSPSEYANYYSCLSPSYFTTRAPTGYSFSTITDSAILTAERPFYSALKYIFSIIPHFAPSTISESSTHFSEHTYFVYLNRLIYYYNIYIGISTNNLKGFENTAVIVILTHGSYEAFDDIATLDTTPNVENVFICTKAAPGTVSQVCKLEVEKDRFASEGNMFDQIYDSINQFKAVSFDDISTEAYKYKRGTTEANCWVVNKQFGKSMQHYISPSTKGYINKIYDGGESDSTNAIIDITKFKESRTTASDDINTRLQPSNILFDPKLLETINDSPSSFINMDESNNTITSFRIELRDIINYYNTLGIQNLFIYDISCGVLKDKYLSFMDDISKYGMLQTVLSEYYDFERTEMGKVTSKLAKLGFGDSKKKRKRRTKTKRNQQPRKTRKHHKRTTHNRRSTRRHKHHKKKT